MKSRKLLHNFTYIKLSKQLYAINLKLIIIQNGNHALRSPSARGRRN